MAEIHVQPKRKASAAWLWIILFLLIVGSVVAYIMLRDENRPDQTSTQKQTSFIETNKADRI